MINIIFKEEITMISKEKKAEIIAAYGRTPQDTGSPEVQQIRGGRHSASFFVSLVTEVYPETTEIHTFA